MSDVQMDAGEVLDAVVAEFNESENPETEPEAEAEANPEPEPEADTPDESTDEDVDKEAEPEGDEPEDDFDYEATVARFKELQEKERLWNETKNPEHLKGTPWEQTNNNLVQHERRRTQELVEARKELEAARAALAQPQPQQQPSQKPETLPSIPRELVGDEVATAFEQRLAAQQQQIAQMLEAKLTPIQKQAAENEKQAARTAALADLTGREGYTPEVDAVMGELYNRHKGEAWMEGALFSPAGRDMLFSQALQEANTRAVAKQRAEEDNKRIEKATGARQRAVSSKRTAGRKSEADVPDPGDYDNTTDFVLAELAREESK